MWLLRDASIRCSPRTGRNLISSDVRIIAASLRRTFASSIPVTHYLTHYRAAARGNRPDAAVALSQQSGMSGTVSKGIGESYAHQRLAAALATRFNSLGGCDP